MKSKLTDLLLWIFRFLGSIKFAMLLIGVVIVASIFGTLIESGFNARVAQTYIYDAPWFIVWLLLLCTNLIVAVMVRYPWKPHQWGFVITHGGIVVILAGGIVGRIWGLEGTMTLHEDGSPQNFLVVNETLLQVQDAGGKIDSFSLNLDVREPKPERPLRFQSGEVGVTVLEVANELGRRRVVEPGGTGDSPALRLIMEGNAAPHAIDQWLVRDNPQQGEITMGRSVVRFAGERDAGSPATGNGVSGDPSREIHFVFAKVEGMNVSRGVSGKESGATAGYRRDTDPDPSTGNGEDLGVLEVKLEGREFAFAVGDILNAGIPLEGTDWNLEILRTFSDFRIEGNQPVNVSDEPNNPALIFELTGPPGQPEDGDGECCDADAEAAVAAVPEVVDGDDCCSDESGAEDEFGADASGLPLMPSADGRSAPAHNGPAGNELILRYEEGSLLYESRTAEGEHNGAIEVGEDFAAGWPGWRFRVEEIIDRAAVREELVPMEGAGMTSLGASGLRVYLEDGEHSVERWLEMGKTTFVPFGDHRLHMGFGFRLYPLDFQVELERFEVDFNAGTQMPAGFKSHVVFTSESGESLAREIWMNNPVNFPHFPGAGLLGTSYKFSQSSWNRENHGQTTLQVIRDPGWSLKWFGSVLFCVGLLMIFYIKPYPRFARMNNKNAPAREAALIHQGPAAQEPLRVRQEAAPDEPVTLDKH